MTEDQQPVSLPDPWRGVIETLARQNEAISSATHSVIMIRVDSAVGRVFLYSYALTQVLAPTQRNTKDLLGSLLQFSQHSIRTILTALLLCSSILYLKKRVLQDTRVRRQRAVARSGASQGYSKPVANGKETKPPSCHSNLAHPAPFQHSPSPSGLRELRKGQALYGREGLVPPRHNSARVTLRNKCSYRGC